MLEAIGLDFEVDVSGVEEISDGDPALAVVENARRKAQAVSSRRSGGEGEELVLGVDTDVVLDGELLGKPVDRAAAERLLRRLSGRTHEVLSGIAVLRSGDGPAAQAETTSTRSKVTFRRLDDELIELYLRSGEWRDRAGGYAVQGLGSILIERIDGDLANVIGLPLGALVELLPELLPVGS